MNQWEYKVVETCTMEDGVYLVSEDDQLPNIEELVAEALARLGRGGWELVAVTKAEIFENLYETLYFKRQI